MIAKLKAIPHILLFKRSANRNAIEKDMLRWFQVYKPRLQKRSSSDLLVWLLDSFPEFRNLFYARIGGFSGIRGRVLARLARMSYPSPKVALRFAEPINIGPGFFARAGFGTIIAAQRIGENCWVNPGVAIGFRDDKSAPPTIGDNVYIGAGAKILGPVTVGDNAVIGANAVVTRDVPPNCTVAGMPARIIRRDGVRVKESHAAS